MEKKDPHVNSTDTLRKTFADYAASKYIIPSNRTVYDTHNAIFLDT